MADFFLGIRVEHNEGVFHAPVGRIGHVRDTGQAIKGDIVAAGVLAQHLEHLAAQIEGVAKTLGETLDCLLGGDHQLPDLGGTLRVFLLAFGAAFFNLTQAVAQGFDQRIAPLAVIKQIVFQVGIALDNPDIAQNFVKHAGGSASDALTAQLIQNRPILGTEQADYDLAIRKRRVVIRDFAQAGSHGSKPGSIKRWILAYCSARRGPIGLINRLEVQCGRLICAIAQ